MDLIDNDKLSRRKVLTDARTEHEIETLRCCDEDIARVAEHPCAVFLRRISGPKVDTDIMTLKAKSFAGSLQSNQWRSQVTLNIVDKSLERRDIDDLEPAF